MEQTRAPHGSVGPMDRVVRGYVRLGACTVAVDLDRVVAPHGETSLEPKAMAVLVHLIARHGEVVSAGELIDVVWRGRPMGDNPVYRCIAQLRRALGDDPRAPTYIATVPTKGYRLIASLGPSDPAAPAAAVIGSERDGTVPAPEIAPPAAPGGGRRRQRWGVIGLVMALVVLVSVLLRWQGESAEAARPAPTMPVTLAVLPLATASPNQADRQLAQSVTDLVRHRAARLPGLLVVAENSAAAAAGHAADPPALAKRLGVRYLLRGSLLPTGSGVHLDLHLLDAKSGRERWSFAWDQPANQLLSRQDEIVARVAEALHVSFAGAARGPIRHAINPQAYASYMHAQQSLWDGGRAGADAALEAFRRATILDPGFARAYLGMGEALLQQAEDEAGPATETRARAAVAIDRALALDPTLGEAWIARARNERDPARAEPLFRKGLALAPSDGAGYERYARFLFADARVGEAIQVMEHARRIDPLAPELCLTQAFFVMVVRSDVAEHDRLVRQALAISPGMPAALYQLAHSKWEYSGHLAEAAQLAEQAIAADPQSMAARMLARDIYLDLDEPEQAQAALGPSPPPMAMVELDQYRGDSQAALAATEGLSPTSWPDNGPHASKAQAVRDAAIASGELAHAQRLLQAVEVAHQGGVPMWYRGFALVYAHVLVLAGNVTEGRALARATLAMVDAHGVGRAAHWFSRERAAAFALLGKNQQAVEALAHSVQNGQTYRWWYLAGHDPLYVPLRGDPAFRALDREVRARRERERALLASMQAGAIKSPSRAARSH